MVLNDVSLYGISGRKHIHIADGIIQAITDDRDALDGVDMKWQLEMDGALVLPGFINSHDHLDFNCYPQLGNRQYANYTEWGKDIHLTHAPAIEAVKKIPHALRVQWGLYKNLLGGFTTVVNHGEMLDTDHSLVEVFQDCYPLHSPAFEKNWISKLNQPFGKTNPVVMHIGEGTDRVAHAEISRVKKYNLLKRPVVAVHGVAMDAKQAYSFAGLVWCPASNYFLLGATADIGNLKEKTRIVFGTDSTLTAPWLSETHFTSALASGKATEKELLDMLTVTPSQLWKMKDRGVVAEGMRADLIVKENTPQLFSQFQKEMLLLIKGGEIMLSAASVPATIESAFDRIIINENVWYVKKGIRQLASAIREYYPDLQLPFITD